MAEFENIHQLKTFIQVKNILSHSVYLKMSEKRTRLSNGDKMAILEAIRIPAGSF